MANRRTALGLVALFAGMLVVFVALAAWQQRAGGPGPDLVGGARGILDRRFDAGVATLLSHNLVTLAVLMLVGFVYRTYGALLALGWNAAHWATVLTILVLRGLPDSDAHPVVFVTVSAAAVLPHLLAEAAAYVVGTLGAIFASRAITRYAASDPRLGRVLRAVLTLVAVAAALLILAAVVEQNVPRRVLDLLR